MPFIREAGGQGIGDISPSEATSFRAMVAAANYLAADRPDIHFGVKEMCWVIAVPTGSSMARAKRLARYLAEYPLL